MVEYNINDILRKQAQEGRREVDKDPEPSYWPEIILLLLVFSWGVGYAWGEFLFSWWAK
jgi:hypothetical protein